MMRTGVMRDNCILLIPFGDGNRTHFSPNPGYGTAAASRMIRLQTKDDIKGWLGRKYFRRRTRFELFSQELRACNALKTVLKIAVLKMLVLRALGARTKDACFEGAERPNISPQNSSTLICFEGARTSGVQRPQNCLNIGSKDACFESARTSGARVPSEPPEVFAPSKSPKLVPFEVQLRIQQYYSQCRS